VVNGVLIAALAAAAVPGASAPRGAIAVVGGGLVAAMGLRLLWLHWRQRRWASPRDARNTPAPTLPPVNAWWWGGLAAGLPLVLPFAARSIASGTGEGALAVFSYAWKLVELPLMLAVQLVAVLA
jgi:putative peptidoglycan lipid II flippase